MRQKTEPTATKPEVDRAVTVVAIVDVVDNGIVVAHTIAVVDSVVVSTNVVDDGVGVGVGVHIIVVVENATDVGRGRGIHRDHPLHSHAESLCAQQRCVHAVK